MPRLGARPFACALACVATAAALLVTASACGGPSEAGARGRPLAPYAGRSADLFDDTIEPAAVGLDFDKGYAPRIDRALRERTETADAVLRVRITTVTAKTDGPDASYELGLRTVDTLGGKHPPPATFVLRIDKASESYGIMKSFGGRLVGQSFIAFVREFADSSGERELHFHLAPDNEAVRAAVGDAFLLGELK